MTKISSERIASIEARKHELAEAMSAEDLSVEKIFDVKVTSVNTMNRQGKTRRTRYGTGRRADTKRAIVSLAEGQRIDIFGGPVS